jgi:hypothetical protein
MKAKWSPAGNRNWFRYPPQPTAQTAQSAQAAHEGWTLIVPETIDQLASVSTEKRISHGMRIAVPILSVSPSGLPPVSPHGNLC